MIGRGRTLLGDFGATAQRVADAHAAGFWPALQWADDPEGYCEIILGVELWDFERDFLAAICDGATGRGPARVSVSGGRKVSKDHVIGCAANWWVDTRPRGLVFASSVTGAHLDRVWYKQVRELRAEAGRCLTCKRSDPKGPRPCAHSAVPVGKIGERAHTGIKCDDGRAIFGFTADTPEALAGISGINILACIDEGSGYPDDLHAAIRGNLAASGCVEVAASNPTRTRGWFFDSHHGKAELYRTFSIPSTSSPNVTSGDPNRIPGLATPAWIEEAKRDWGEDSHLYAVHVLAKFPVAEQGAIFTVHALSQSVSLWPDAEVYGPIVVGLDPAGPSGGGDYSGFAVRRGKKILDVLTQRGLTPEAHLVHVLGIVATHGGSSHGLPVVVIDRDGEQGAKVWGVFVSHRDQNPKAFELIGVRGGERAHRQPMTYDRQRDEVFANLADWIRDGGALPSDPRLQRELNAFRWITHVSGRSKVLGKDELRRELGGASPDRADAVALACWAHSQVGATTEAAAHRGASQATNIYEQGRLNDRAIDPYQGVPGTVAWRPGWNGGRGGSAACPSCASYPCRCRGGNGARSF